MNAEKIMKIFKDTAYVRVGGSDAELKAAKYLKSIFDETGYSAVIEDFNVNKADMKSASLLVDGREIECKGYLCCGSGSVEAELYYLCDTDKFSYSNCKGKIVLFDGYLGYWKFHDLCDAGAVGFISYDGNVNYSDRDIDARELRSYVSQGKKMLGVNINAKDALAIVKSGARVAKISVEQDEYEGVSRNVILDIPGQSRETVIFSAHYDSTSLSQGAYDNMSGCVALLSMAEYFTKNPVKRSLRFILCGSEERGLLGSKAYCAKHKEELSDAVLNINVDMIGSAMGRFNACCSCEDKVVSYISYMGMELGMQVNSYQDIHSSDSTAFADSGVPAVSFARSCPGNIATIHNSYDTKAVLMPKNIIKDTEFIKKFAQRMADAQFFPICREIPENIKSKLDSYLCRKR